MRITGEPTRDTLAQLAALRDPSSAKDAALITPNSLLPPGVLAGLSQVPTAHGLFATTSAGKAREAAGADSDGMGALLGYTSRKAETDGTVVQALDGAGNVVHEEVTSVAMLPQATARAEQMVPRGGRVNITDALSMQARRAILTEGEAMNGMGGGFDPQMLQMMMMARGGMGGGMGAGGFGGQRQAMPPMQMPQAQPSAPPVTANLGLPSMAQPQQFQQSPLVANFGQNMQGMQAQPQQSWMRRNGGNMQNAALALLQSGML